ncbi:MAG: GAF domain-containing protein [Thermomicrobiales bacterium]|nr:GAF domain-containing protein [Thermomicrobiales bacterium]
MVAGDRDPGNQRSQDIAAYEAALTIAEETTPGAVLQRVVDLARRVVPARYAALGVADDSGRICQFMTSGITPEERARFGPIPEGHGLLRELIEQRVPLLIPDIAADPRSVGFPPGHPPMRTLIGVPLVLGERVLGNLYLTERLDGEPFDVRDLQALQILAVHAAAAIDRASAYQRVEAQRDQLRIILDSLPAGVLIVTAPDARIELTNRALTTMLFGPASPPGRLPVYGRDLRLLQSDGTPLLHDERPSVRALKGEVLHNQQFLVESGRVQHIPVLTQAMPLPNASGEVERAVLVFQDITRLREAEQLKDDFLSLVSHEVRTPLTTIHGGAHLLLDQGEALSEQTRHELLCDIVEESNRLDRMMANMLVLTDVMAGRLAPRTEPLLVEPLAREVAADVAERAPDHTFVVEMPRGMPAAEGDPELLSQVLHNLYENAVKYSPDGGQIRTTARSNGCTVTIEVADQGIGLDPGDVDQVFERFYRTGSHGGVRGTGLGLYLSRHLVQAQGGKIAAWSAGHGKGSVFTITLPAAREWADSLEEQLAATANPR